MITFDLTDHMPTFINIKFDFSLKKPKRKIRFRLVNYENNNIFKSLLRNFDWSSMQGEANAFALNFQNPINALLL